MRMSIFYMLAGAVIIIAVHRFLNKKLLGVVRSPFYPEIWWIRRKAKKRARSPVASEADVIDFERDRHDSSAFVALIAVTPIQSIKIDETVNDEELGCSIMRQLAEKQRP